MSEEKILQNKERNYGVDIVKFLASIAVVMIHIDSNFRPYEFIPNTQLWDVSIIINLLTKWSVPAFIICSGYFILNDNKSFTYKEFINKRLSKILIPFISMSLIFTIYYQYLNGDVSLKWALVGLIKNLFGYPPSAHLWFLYPLLGLYLLTPLFKGMLNELDNKLIIIMIIICFLVKTIVPFTDVLVGWSSNYWRDVPIAINAFALYFLIGGYLGRVEISKKFKLCLYISNIILLIIAFALMFKVEFLYNRQLEVLIDISSINNLVMCCSIFIFFKDLNLKNSKILKSILSFLSDVNFGVFLLHPIFIDITKNMFGQISNNVVVHMLLQLTIVYIFTAIVVYVIKQIPFINRIV